MGVTLVASSACISLKRYEVELFFLDEFLLQQY
jgi:hypothetical protein